MPFVDDFSRMTFVYYLKHKHEALTMFQHFLNMAERQTSKKFCKLRTDGAGELTSNAFISFCQDKGILKQVIVPHSSQMNGVAEIKHQVLQFQARTMLIHAWLPKCLWAEAVETANYILNRLPSAAIQGQVPYTKWSGQKPSLQH